MGGGRARARGAPASTSRSRCSTAAAGTPLGSTRYLSLRPEHRGLEIGWTWLTRSAWSTGANVEAKLRCSSTRSTGSVACVSSSRRTPRMSGRGERWPRCPRSSRVSSASTCSSGTTARLLAPSAWFAIVDDDWPAGEGEPERRSRATGTGRTGELGAHRVQHGIRQAGGVLAEGLASQGASAAGPRPGCGLGPVRSARDEPRRAACCRLRR